MRCGDLLPLALTFIQSPVPAGWNHRGELGANN